MKKKLYIVSDKNDVNYILCFDHLPWNSFKTKRKAKCYCKKAEAGYYNKPKVYKVTVEEV